MVHCVFLSLYYGITFMRATIGSSQVFVPPLEYSLGLCLQKTFNQSLWKWLLESVTVRRMCSHRYFWRLHSYKKYSVKRCQAKKGGIWLKAQIWDFLNLAKNIWETWKKRVGFEQMFAKKSQECELGLACYFHLGEFGHMRLSDYLWEFPKEKRNNQASWPRGFSVNCSEYFVFFYLRQKITLSPILPTLPNAQCFNL